jgi:hypothetical protein
MKRVGAGSAPSPHGGPEGNQGLLLIIELSGFTHFAMTSFESLSGTISFSPRCFSLHSLRRSGAGNRYRGPSLEAFVLVG